MVHVGAGTRAECFLQRLVSMPLLLVSSLPSFDEISTTRSKFDRARLADTLLETAAAHVATDPREALRRVDDLLPLVDGIEDDLEWAERSVVVGEILLALDETHRAREHFEEASVILDERDEPALLARSLFGLGRVMTMLHDPVGRTVLEDARSLIEELGDEAAVFAVDVELRHLAADNDEMPPSAHAIAAPDTRSRC
jgi:hypothetical protein